MFSLSLSELRFAQSFSEKLSIEGAGFHETFSISHYVLNVWRRNTGEDEKSEFQQLLLGKQKLVKKVIESESAESVSGLSCFLIECEKIWD